MIPAPRLLWLCVVPLLLSGLYLLDRQALWPLLAANAVIVLAAVADAALSFRPALRVAREAPRVMSLGRDNRVRLELTSLSRRRLAVRVNQDMFDGAVSADLPLAVTLAAGERRSLAFHVEPRRRGAHSLGAHYLRYPTLLGLFQRQLKVNAEDGVRVYPDLAQIKSYELLARHDRQLGQVRALRLKAGESEFERLRDYTPDDEYRALDWKATARRQKLIAKEFQLESNQSLVCMLDAGRLMAAETGRLSYFDHALNAALMLSHVAVRVGDRAGLLAFDTQVRAFVAPSGGPSATRKLIRMSYDLHPVLEEPDFDAAFEFLALRVRKRSLVVLFSQLVDDAAVASVARRIQAIARRHLVLVVVFRDVELFEILDHPPAKDREIYEQGAAAELLRWRDGVLTDFKRRGALVLDVDPGKLTPSLLNRYLEIKARHLL